MAFSSVEIYSSCQPIVVNCILYTNYQLTTRAAAGHYKLPNNTVATTNSVGVVTSITNC